MPKMPKQSKHHPNAARSHNHESLSLSFPPSVRMTTLTQAAYASLIAHAMQVSLTFATTALNP